MGDGPGRLVDRLAAIAGVNETLAVGLMSGTSCDSIDAALARISKRDGGRSVELEAFESVPFESGLRERIRAAPGASAREIAVLDFDLGEAFAGAALKVIEASDRARSDVVLIGSHGQTVYHESPTGGGRGATLQLGDGDVIAQRTGVITVSDFRSADIALGGTGAPLIPLVDWFLFRKPGRARLLLNLGGIANVTFVSDRAEDIVAFDTGPGNALLDEIVSAATGGGERFDRGGRMAMEGVAKEHAVERFLGKAYFAEKPPKSTGKELFGAEAAGCLSELALGRGLGPDMNGEELRDLLATAAAVTARAVRRAADAFVPPVDEIVVSGGGVHNAAVMSALRSEFGRLPVVSLESLGMDPDAKEAVGFAMLAHETVNGLPGNVPGATGARRAAVLGKISAGF